MCRLHIADIRFADLTPAQVSTLMTMIADKDDLRLHTIGLPGNNIADVAEYTLARAICRLQSVDLRRTNMTPLQVGTLITTIADTADLRLKSVSLDWNGLYDQAKDTLAEKFVECKLWKWQDRSN